MSMDNVPWVLGPEEFDCTCPDVRPLTNAVHGIWTADFAANAALHQADGGKAVFGRYWASANGAACEELCRETSGCAVFSFFLHAVRGGQCALMTAQEAESVGSLDPAAWRAGAPQGAVSGQ